MKDQVAKFACVVRGVVDAIDRFGAGEPWLRFRVILAERRLERTLRVFGDGTFEERRAAAAVRYADQDAKLWRRIPPNLRGPAEWLESKGVSVNDLRVVFLNLEVRHAGKSVELAPAWRSFFLTAVSVPVILFGHVLLATIITLAPGEAAHKALVMSMMTALMCVLYRAFSLYTSRPIRTRPRVARHLPLETSAIGSVTPTTRRFLDNRTQG